MREELAAAETWTAQEHQVPPAVCWSLSVVCCLLSAVCCLLSVVCCLLSAVCCLFSAFCCLLSAVCCLLAAAETWTVQEHQVPLYYLTFY
jgi:hypothetical protein